MPETWQDFHFPKAGLHTAGAFGRQPTRQGKDGQYVRTAAAGENVRSFDCITGRDRGGSRAGISKYVAQAVSPSAEMPFPSTPWVVQELRTIATTKGLVTSMQQSNSGRIVYLVAVSQGVVKVATPGDTTWTATINSTGETPPLNITGPMQSSPNNQKLYFVDGINYVYYNPPSNEVKKWTPTKGQLPRDTDNNGCRIISTWRGRLALSGLLGDPQNIFFTKVSDPNDFEYEPATTTETDAVALNLSRLGLIGDVVTGLVPYTDDVMIVLGDHTIWAIKGDPAASGKTHLISDITGAAFGEAWCKDPYGNVYFFGNRPSIWKMAGTEQPERISQPIEPLLKDINTGENLIRLVWNDRQQAVHVFVTPIEEPAEATHFVWEFRTNSWWQDTFANNDHNPLCCVEYDGNEPGDRAVLLGCWDGYVRLLDPNAATDDGTTINSYVLIGPILTQELDEMLLKDIQWVMATGSGDITWEVLSGRTAEEALAAAARASGTASAGRNLNQPIRVADHAIYLKVSATTRWAMETVRARFDGRGKVRRRN